MRTPHDTPSSGLSTSSQAAPSAHGSARSVDEAPTLEVRQVSKSFPPTRALDGVSIAFRRGEIHGLVGENGAGKSTLMRILAGLQRPDEGSVLIDGQPVELRSAGEAIDRGIAMIHQELNLVGGLTVAENIALGREPTRWGLTDRGRMNREAGELLRMLGASVSPTALVSRLSVAEQQLVEIAKALSLRVPGGRILIMDEPTAVLSERETAALLDLMRRLAAGGATILYISHLLPEVLGVCHRISVLRDGRLVGTVDPASVDERGLASMMVGRPLVDVFPQRRRVDQSAPRLEVRDLAAGPSVRRVSFSVGGGEIVGLAGLVGSGRTETAEAIIGLRRIEAGEVRVRERRVRFRSPRHALAAGVAYLSEDRKGRGVHLDLSCSANVTLANLKAYGRVFPSGRRELASARRWIERLTIRCASPKVAIRTLSGGNQQKFALAKWLDAEPSVLILDEPTRGIDLGAKVEIYRLVAALADAGLACVVISSELPELLGLCHRIVVLREGEVAGALSADEATEQSIMHMAAGVDTRGARGGIAA